MERIQLVTRSDDAGMNKTANKAIRAASRQGIVRNISLMAPAPWIEHAAESMQDLSGKVDFGLHACLTSEWQNLRWGPVEPLATVPTLTREDGTFPADVDELVSMTPDLDQLMIEVRTQYQKLADLGFHLSYLDEHMGVGRVPGFGELLVAFAAEVGLVCNRTLFQDGRLSRLPDWVGPEEHPGTELSDHLAAVPPGTYLLVGHPGFKTEEMEALRRPGQSRGEVMIERSRERRMFADIEIVDYCEYGAIDLTRYSEVP